jgi:hypothetical protein
LVQRSR